MTDNEVSAATSRKKPRVFYGYIIVLAGFFVLMVAFGTLYSFGIFLKPVSAEFGWTRAVTSGAYSLFTVLQGFITIFAGGLTDRFGPRRIIVGCGFFLGLGYLLMSQVGAIWQLYLFYGVMIGVGMGTSFVPVVSTIARWFAKRRGLMTGIGVSGIGSGTIIMPPLASQFIASYGWRTSYIIIGIIALTLIPLAAQVLKRDPSQIGQLPYGENEVRPENVVSEATGFSLQQAVRARQFWLLSAAFFFFSFYQQTIMIHIVPYANDTGISATSAASVLSIIGGLSIAGRIGMGSVADKLGTKPTIIISLVFLSSALFWLLGAKALWMLYLFAVVFGFGYGAMIALMSPMVADLFGLKAHGAILGMAIFGSTIGGATGPLFTGKIFDMTESYQLAFLVIAMVSIMALILTSLLTPLRKEGLGGSV